VQPRHLDTQLPPVAGLGQGNVADVKFEVEIGIVDPIGMVEIEWNADKFLAKAACLVQAAFYVRQYVLEPYEPPGCGRRVIDPDRADMHRRIWGVEIDETGILPTKLLHEFLLSVEEINVEASGWRV